MKRFIFFASLFLISLTFFIPSHIVFAQAAGKGVQLDKELSHFKDKGAVGYLIWQYSGDRNAPLGDTDKWSIFRNDLGDANDPSSVCGAMKKWSGQYEFLGFNVYSLGQGRGGPLSSGQIADQLNALKACGTNVVRVFIGRSCPGAPSATPECVRRMLAGAQSAGVSLILAVGDFANGGGGFPKLSRDQVASWYGGGYLSSQWPEYLRQTTSAAAGNSKLYGIELSNEPHCYDVSEAVARYNQWASFGVSIAKRASGNVGLGQMASNANSSCDAPDKNLLPGNRAAGATMVSAHYYTDDERDQADAAADKIVPSGLKFYIGESALLGLKKFPSAGQFRDVSQGKAPMTLQETRNVGLGSDFISANESVIINPDAFTNNTTVANFTKEDNVLSAALHDELGGGKLTPAFFTQGDKQFVYIDEQPEYISSDEAKLKEVYAAGCGQAQLRVKNETQGSKQQRISYQAAQSAALPTPYVRMISHAEIMSAILVPGQATTGQIKAQQPRIVNDNGDGTFTITDEYKSQLFPCNADTARQQVAAVQIPAEGPLQQILASVGAAITNIINVILGRECTTAPDGTQTCYDKNAAAVDITNTKTVFTPGTQRLANFMTSDDKGFTTALRPSAISLTREEGYTNKNQSGNSNVLAASTNSNDNIPEFQTHGDKLAWKTLSECELVPAAIQEQRGTKCTPEGGAAAPTQAPSVASTGKYCSAPNPSNVTNGPDRTFISDGLIALALNVSKYTCTPAEFIIGTIAGEIRGLNMVSPENQNEIIQAKDPNERICRYLPCLSGQTGELGPYSWTKSFYAGYTDENDQFHPGQFQNWGTRATNCFNALGVSSTSPDARSLGQATCITAAKFWASMSNDQSCDGRSRGLNEISPDKLKLAYMHFCGSDPRCGTTFWAKDQGLIDAYKAAVARVKGEMASCLR